MKRSDPSALIKPNPEHTQSIELWVRIAGFLAGRAQTSQRTYTSVLSEWCAFLGVEAGTEAAAKRLAAATDLDALAYRTELQRRQGQRPRYRSTHQPSTAPARRGGLGQRNDGSSSNQANATIVKKFSILRRIYRLLGATGLATGPNPFDSDRVPPPPREAGRKRPTEMVDFALVEQIVNAPPTDSPKGLRDRAILALLFGAGLRRSEVAALRLADLKRSPQGTIYLYLRSTKGKRDAEQALPEWAIEALKPVVAQRQADKAQPGDPLFVCYSGRAGLTPTRRGVSSSGIYNLFKFWCAAVGASAHCTPHSARATAITRLLDDGVSHRDVREFSRHASVQMVELYDKRRANVEQNPGRSLSYSKSTDHQNPKT